MKLHKPTSPHVVSFAGARPLALTKRQAVTALGSSKLVAGMLGMLDDDANDFGEMILEVEWRDRTMGIPLAQIKGFNVDEKTAEAIADRHYWVAQR